MESTLYKEKLRCLGFIATERETSVDKPVYVVHTKGKVYYYLRAANSVNGCMITEAPYNFYEEGLVYMVEYKPLVGYMVALEEGVVFEETDTHLIYKSIDGRWKFDILKHKVSSLMAKNIVAKVDDVIESKFVDLEDPEKSSTWMYDQFTSSVEYLLNILSISTVEEDLTALLNTDVEVGYVYIREDGFYVSSESNAIGYVKGVSLVEKEIATQNIKELYQLVKASKEDVYMLVDRNQNVFKVGEYYLEFDTNTAVKAGFKTIFNQLNTSRTEKGSEFLVRYDYLSMIVTAYAVDADKLKISYDKDSDCLSIAPVKEDSAGVESVLEHDLGSLSERDHIKINAKEFIKYIKSMKAFSTSEYEGKAARDIRFELKITEDTGELYYKYRDYEGVFGGIA